MRRMRKSITGKLKYSLIAVLVVVAFIIAAVAVPLTSEGMSGAVWKAKGKSSLSLTLDPTELVLGTSLHGKGVLMGLTAIGSASIAVKIVLPDGSAAYPVQGSKVRTDSKGTYVIDYTPIMTGLHKITVIFSGNNRYSSSSDMESFNVVNVPSAPMRWMWQELPSSIIVGETATCSASFEKLGSDGTWSGVSGLTVRYMFSGCGGSVVKTATEPTDGSGTTVVRFDPCSAGEWTVQCSCEYDNMTYAMGSELIRSITVTAPSSTDNGTNQTNDSNGSGTNSTTDPGSNSTDGSGDPDPVQAPSSYDYIVSSNVVKDASGATVYTGSNFAAAIGWAVGQANKVVYVPSGTYYLSISISQFASGVTLMGDGPGHTEFNFALGSTSTGFFTLGFKLTNVNNVVLKQFGMTGNAAIAFYTTSGTTTNNLVQDVTIHDTPGAQLTTFGVIVGNGLIASNYQFVRCIAYNIGGDGFDLWGMEPSYDSSVVKANGGWIRGAYFEDCRSMWAGYSGRYWDWTPGWDIGERCNVDNIKFVRCEASYSWESGFHVEGIGTYTNIVLQDCVANYNGQKWSDPRGAAYGYGCCGDNYIKTSNFKGVGNAQGLGPYWMPAYSYTDNPSYYTYALSSSTVKDVNGATVYTGSSFTDALQWAVSHANAIVYVPTGTYAVTGTITLASGVTLFGINPQQNFNPARHTVFSFSSAAGFLIKDVSNVKLANFDIKNGNIQWMCTGGTMTGNQAKGINIYSTSSLLPFAVGATCAGGTISGLLLGAVLVSGSATDAFEFTKSGSGSISGTVMNQCRSVTNGVTTPAIAP